MQIKKVLGCLLLTAVLQQGRAQNNSNIVINPTKIVSEIQPTMWGVFFEDINMGADGGIYAELVKNRSFEFYKPLMGWTVQQRRRIEGAVTVQNRLANEQKNPRFLRVQNSVENPVTLINEGFRGMGIKKGNRYDFSVLYRQADVGINIKLQLIGAKGTILGTAALATPQSGSEWHNASVSFTASDSAMKGQLQILFEGNGDMDLDMISLFPGDTWKGRPKGMRADMIQLLADMKPGFIRFPGGCIVEGHDLSTRFQWKKTVGPIEQREMIVNRWNTEFAHRPTPDYYQTFGLGFFEYFQIAEDIGATALPILNCGMACQFNTAELVSLDELEPYIQDALDLIEFANGATTSTWGKLRAQMGHAESFNLKYLGVGNENWGPQYIERLELFQKAIKAKYPEIKLVTSSGTDPDGERFDYLNKELRRMNADIIDEHYYRHPDWFLANAKRYDNYDRNGAKVFAGEYAAQTDRTTSIHNRNNWRGAIAEAAFLTGLERNAQVVTMASYAPLFAHVDGWQWRPDMIWVDNLRSVGTPNYQVQKLYATNKGTHVVSIKMNNEIVAGQDSLYASAAIDKATNEIVVKLVNASGKTVVKNLQFDGVKKLGKQAIQIVLQSSDLAVENSLDNPTNLVPVTTSFPIKGKKIAYTALPYSMTVLRITMN